MSLIFLDLDQKLQNLRVLEAGANRDTTSKLSQRLEESWIFHDLRLEGHTFVDNELQRALDGRTGVTWREDQLLQKVRYMQRAIAFVQTQESGEQPFDLQFVKTVHRLLRSPTEETGGRYRKQQPENCAYRHDVISAQGISYRLRRLLATVEKEGAHTHPITMACQIHHDLMTIFPFRNDNGLVARLCMNGWLLRNNYSPALIHSQERQQYFDAYLTGNGVFRNLIVKSILQVIEARTREQQQMPHSSHLGSFQYKSKTGLEAGAAVLAHPTELRSALNGTAINP